MHLFSSHKFGISIGAGYRSCGARVAFCLCRQYSITFPRHNRLQSESCAVEDAKGSGIPRWARKLPVKISSHQDQVSSSKHPYPINEDPELLNKIFTNILGKDGDKILPESIKWLTVTHKSFDHGRKGFNERLAFLGKRIVELQTSLALLDAPGIANKNRLDKDSPDQFGRRRFVHRSLENIESVTVSIREHILDQRRLARLAERYGIATVIRWKPREVGNLRSSGLDSVLTDAIYAIIGALALHKGGELANEIVRSRILNPLGIR